VSRAADRGTGEVEDRGAVTSIPFVGREAELAHVGPLLAETRLLTLTGAGGVGKTRLALEAVRRVSDHERSETFVFELARVAADELVAAAILEGLGVRQEPGSEPLARIVALLAGRSARLVIDNCEHVGEEVAVVLGELLERCPRLRVLATVRQPLGLPASWCGRCRGCRFPISTARRCWR
jgi:predicted ATPase